MLKSGMSKCVCECSTFSVLLIIESSRFSQSSTATSHYELLLLLHLGFCLVFQLALALALAFDLDLDHFHFQVLNLSLFSCSMAYQYYTSYFAPNFQPPRSVAAVALPLLCNANTISVLAFLSLVKMAKRELTFLLESTKFDLKGLGVGS